MPLSSFCWNCGRVEKMRQSVETTTNMQDTTATTWSRVPWHKLAMIPHLGSAGVVGILKQVPEAPLHPRAVVVPKLLVKIIILKQEYNLILCIMRPKLENSTENALLY